MCAAECVSLETAYTIVVATLCDSQFRRRDGILSVAIMGC